MRPPRGAKAHPVPFFTGSPPANRRLQQPLSSLLSFSPYMSLSPTLLLQAHDVTMIYCSHGKLRSTRRQEWVKRCQCWESRLSATEVLQMAVMSCEWGNTVEQQQNVVLQPLPPPVHLNLFIIMVPLVHDKSGQINDTYFCTNWQNFNSWSKPNRALFEVMILYC